MRMETVPLPPANTSALSSREPLAVLDQGAFLRWALTSVGYLAERQDDLNELNVFPVPDGDTGTNLLRTLSAALQRALSNPALRHKPLSERLAEVSRDALRSARGNSGVILSQLMVGLAEGVASTAENGDDPRDQPLDGLGPRELAAALETAALRGREGVHHPLDGTILSVAQAAADAGRTAAEEGDDLGEVVSKVVASAEEALAATTGKLEELREAGVVDAGGAGLVMILRALEDVVHGQRRVPAPEEPRFEDTLPAVGDAGDDLFGCRTERAAWATAHGGETVMYEVVYHLENASVGALDELAHALELIGDSVVVGGSIEVEGRREVAAVHVHTAEPGQAVEEAYAIGRPGGIRVEVLTEKASAPRAGLAGWAPALLGPAPALTRAAPTEWTLQDGLSVVVGARGAGLLRLMRDTGARTVETPALVESSRAVASETTRRVVDAFVAEVLAARARDVLVLPADEAAVRAAPGLRERARIDLEPKGIRLVVAETHHPVQALAACIVLDENAPPAEEARRLAASAESVACGYVEESSRPVTYAAGAVRAGDFIGYAGGDVRATGIDAIEVTSQLIDYLAESGGSETELITVVGGEGCESLLGPIALRVEREYPDAEVVTVDGGTPGHVVAVGVE